MKLKNKKLNQVKNKILVLHSKYSQKNKIYKMRQTSLLKAGWINLGSGDGLQWTENNIYIITDIHCLSWINLYTKNIHVENQSKIHLVGMSMQ